MCISSIYFLGLTETMVPSLDVNYFLSTNKNLVSDIPHIRYFILKTMVKFIKSINGSLVVPLGGKVVSAGI